MDAALDSTRGFERNDPRWHCRIEIAETIDEILMLVRDYVATLDPEILRHLPDACRTLRVKAEDDIEYWTFKLSQRPAGREGAGIDADLLQEVFNHFLHASLRLSQIHKFAASATLSTHEN